MLGGEHHATLRSSHVSLKGIRSIYVRSAAIVATWNNTTRALYERAQPHASFRIGILRRLCPCDSTRRASGSRFMLRIIGAGDVFNDQFTERLCRLRAGKRAFKASDAHVRCVVLSERRRASEEARCRCFAYQRTTKRIHSRFSGGTCTNASTSLRPRRQA